MQSGVIISNTRLQGDYFKVTFYTPEICATAQPGQFVHVKIANMEEHILRRPFSICNVSGSGELEVVYKVVGVGTEVLSKLPEGTLCDLLGPLGKPFQAPAADEVPVLLGGGYGAAAMFMLTKKSAQPGVVLLGARSKNDLLLIDDYKHSGFDVRLATNDGSSGIKGLITELLPPLFADYAGKKLHFYACGPMPMLLALCRILPEKGYPEAEVSLDHLMCCGVGACFACVVKIKADNPDGFRYARTCSEGPVFAAKDVYLGE